MNRLLKTLVLAAGGGVLFAVGFGLGWAATLTIEGWDQ